MPRHSISRVPSNNGFALVITLIMLVLAAVVSVAFITNASLDRLTANSFSKRTRAEMAAQSGLAAALNALAGANGPSDFRFITGVGDNDNSDDPNNPIHSKPVLIPLNYDSASGRVSLNLTSKRDLYSTGTGATITLSATTSPKATRAVGYVPIDTVVNGANQEAERYAFYVDEAASRQNLMAQGGNSRMYARDPNELPLVTATAAPVVLNTTQLDAIKNQRALLFTPTTTNPVLSDANAITSPPVDDYSYTTASTITNLTPEGKPRVNLAKLKSYVDGLSVDQSAGNPRSHLVDRLLDSGEQGAEWNGGNLSILTKLGHYSTAQCQQIVANLLDYLDSDVIPTTDKIDNPTYFGVEGKANPDGTISGHPYINFVGTGLVFNRSNASGFQGGLNSTRILTVIGLVNPWSAETKDWTVFYTKPELEIAIQGAASGGNLGTNAADYFHGPTRPTPATRAFNTSDSGNQLTSYPTQTTGGKIPPNKGFAWPTNMGSSTNYATNYDILGTYGRQPPGMVFSGLGFKVTKLRLKYTSTDGYDGYVQVLDNLATTVQPANPSTVDLDHAGGSLVYKFASGAPDKTDFHLNSDPRLSFKAVATNWLLSKSTENAASPPNPQSPVNVFNGHDDNNWDFTGQAPTETNHLWYTKPDVTGNFYVKSPARDGSDPKMDSAGEMGYLHTGIPWETLRLYVTDSEANTATPKSRDREILGYVHSGTFANANYTSVPTHPGQTNPPKPIPLLSGTLSLNINKEPTLHSLLLGASALVDSDATARANGSANDPDVTNLAKGLSANAAAAAADASKWFSLPGDFLSLQAVRTVTNGQTKDFDREILARRTANVSATQSTRFTVYSVGEARDKIGTGMVTTSTVNLRAEVELQTDSSGKPVPKVLSTAYYLTN